MVNYAMLKQFANASASVDHHYRETSAASRRDILANGKWLHPGGPWHTLWSGNNIYRFTIEHNGRMAVYKHDRLVWHNTEEVHNDVKGIKMQEDGNLVVYSNNDTPLWASGTVGYSDALLIMGNNGLLGIETSGGNLAWYINCDL